MPAPEFLWLVKESSYGVPMSNPVAGTDALYIRLTDGNAFTMVATPVIQEIPYGGGLAVTAEAVSDFTAVQGSLRTKLYPSQAPLLLGWLLTRVGADQAQPWPTTEPPGDLASVSAYHAVQRSDGTYKRTRYAGVKPLSGRLACARPAPIWTLSLDLVAQRNVGNLHDGSADPTAAEFPAPGEADYPTGPYLFLHSAPQDGQGGFQVGTVRTQYESLAIAVRNALDARPFESRFLQVCSFRGRASTLEAHLRLKATPDDRAAYEALVAQATRLTLNDGTHTCVLDFRGQNTITKLPHDLPLDKVFMITLALKNRWDPAAGGDVQVSFG
jgi:hypothetical protein